MSGRSGYGKISTSGLTFSYDLGDTDVSYKGKPTTNLVPNPSTMSSFSNYSCGTPVTFTTEFGTTGYRMHNLGSWNGVGIGISSLPSAGTYTFSAYIRYLGGSPNNNGGTVYTSGFGVGYDTAAYHNKSIVGEWFRLTNTQTCTTAGGTFYLISYGGTYCDDYSSWEVTMPQIEAGSVATPFVDGTRSGTNALIDITGTNTIDAANVSYASNGEMSFDGTDDYIGLPNGLMQGTGDFTVNQVIQCSAGVVGGTTFGSYPSGPLQIFYGNTYMGMWLDNNSAYVASPLPFTTNTVMITATRTGSVTRFYQNGELLKTGSASSSVGSSGTLFRIGTNTVGTERFTGKIYTTQVYNRALSETEIRNNLLQYVDRYGITLKDGSTQALAAPSAQYLADIGIKANGVYWINNGTTTKQTYCEFKNGEGWMLVMNIKSDYYGDSYLSWNNYDNWINDGDELGNPQFPYVGAGQYRNRDIFRYYPTTKWMIKVHNNGNEFGDGSWAAWQINSTYSGQTFKQIMNIDGRTGGGTQISNTYYAQQGMGTSTYARGLDYCSIARTLGHLRVNHLLDNNGVRILGSEQTLETANTDVTRGIGQVYDIVGTSLTNEAYAQYNTHIGPYVNGNSPFTANRRQFTDQLFPDNSNYNAARGEGLNVNPSLTYGGTPAMVAYYHYGIFIK